MLEHSRGVYAIGLLFVLLAVVMYGPSCRGIESAPFLTRYRLARCGYSATTKDLIVDIIIAEPESVIGRSLSIYSEKTDTLSVLAYAAGDRTNDFAWIPGQDGFVVTHRGGMILFRRDTSVNGYRGTSIRCPVEVDYGSCSWCPSGEWLAVACYSRVQPVGYKLGLFNLREEKFMLSNITARAIGLVWTDDATLYVMNDDGAVEVRLESGVPRVVRSIPIGQDVVRFYGMFDGQPVVYEGDKLRLGDKILLRTESGKEYSAIVTEAFIFISVPPSLIVFDKHGNEIYRASSSGAIQVGSVGENPNTIYGIADDGILMRIVMENGRLHIEDVCDLTAK